MRLSKLAPLLVLAGSPVFAQVAFEDFELGNTHDWGIEFGTPSPHFATGGNPGGRIEIMVSNSASNLPALTIVPDVAGHPWAGNFRALGVSGFSYDREVTAGASPFGTQPFLLLGNDGGTRTDFSDDAWAFVQTTDNFQFGASPWTTVSTMIPSASTTLPAGWDAGALPASGLTGADATVIWNSIIQDVSYVGLAMSRPLNGAGFLGNHVMSFDNFLLEGANIITNNYCGPAVVNSAGLSGTMSAAGSALAANNSLTLIASDLPPNQFGIFVTSRDQAFIPGGGAAGNGNICLGGLIGRFNRPGEILSTGTGGTFALATDLTNFPQGSTTASVVAGDTWNFQAWHRDSVGLGSNFTDGLALTFN